MSWEMGVAPPGMAPPGFSEACPPAYPGQPPLPPGPPTPQDAWGGPPPPMPPPVAPGMYPPGPDQAGVPFPDPSNAMYAAGAPPPGPPGWDAGAPPPAAPGIYPPAPDMGGYYGGVQAPPGPPQWQPPAMPAMDTGAMTKYADRGNYSRRKALLIGISYRNSIRPLGGCINDVKNISQFIIERYGFPRDSMVILTDEVGQDHAHVPTKANMLRWMRWLVEDARAGDSLLLHFSGHGSQTPDLGADGDEIDNMDETILPVDYETAGQIVDDDLHAILVKNLPAGVRLTAIFDSCHSGTALDLPYVYDNRGQIICSPEMIANAGGGGKLSQYGQPSKPSTSYVSYGTPYTATSYSSYGTPQATSSYYSSTPSSSGGSYYTSSASYQSNPALAYNMHKKQKFGRLLGQMLVGISHAMMGRDAAGAEGDTRDYSYEAHMSKIAQSDVIMFAGCADEQTSADASIQGERTGAMSYAFIASLRSNPKGLTYAGLLGQMREVLRGQAFGQVPQLSTSHPMDMNRGFTL